MQIKAIILSRLLELNEMTNAFKDKAHLIDIKELEKSLRRTNSIFYVVYIPVFIIMAGIFGLCIYEKGFSLTIFSLAIMYTGMVFRVVYDTKIKILTTQEQIFLMSLVNQIDKEDIRA